MIAKVNDTFKKNRIILFVSMIFFIATANSTFGQNFNYHSDFKELLENSKDKKSDFFYPKLLERFNKNDSTLTNKEMIALQIGFTDNKNYKPYSIIDKEREILSLIKEKKYDEAITKSNKLLETNPLNFTALMEKGFAYMKLNKPDTPFHKERTMKIIRSIKWSGDGSIDNPYFILSPIDGQTLIKYVFGASIGKMGSGRDKNNYFLDMLDMKDEENTTTLYFNINHATEKMFDK